MKKEDIISLRQKLHKYPELSNNEKNTSKRISNFIKEFKPDKEIRLSTTGRAFVFESNEPGPVVMFRADMDALPVEELTSCTYKSVNPGIAHSCGHDGHSAILCGLAGMISENRPKRGKTILLFQPAEEVEQGAKAVIEDKAFSEIIPDYVFALHNIPGFPKNTIIIKEGCFAAASKGMTIRLYGRNSHAAEPEKGISPANAISKIISRLNSLKDDNSHFKDMVLLTFIHISMGEIAFGTSPGYAEIRITLRAYDNRDMNILSSETENIIELVSKEENLRHSIEYGEVFPATVNSAEFTHLIKQASTNAGLEYTIAEQAFKWSEDFAYFTELFKGGLFGLGAGTKQPELHSPYYDFPDEIIPSGINIFYSIYKMLNIE